MIGSPAPDMKLFAYQVQSACDYAKTAAAWLSGQTPQQCFYRERSIARTRALRSRAGRDAIVTTVSIAHIGSLIGDPARVVMLQALIDKQTLIPERIGVDLASS